MEVLTLRRLTKSLLPLALFLSICGGCQRKTSENAGAASPTPAAPADVALKPIAAPLTGSVTPVLVSQGEDSLTKYLHFPTDSESAKVEGAVQFYCDVTEEGIVENTYALVGTNDAFKAAVQAGLDWGRFTPATVDGYPVRAYVGGTVLFLHRNKQDLVVVSLATQDRERVGKLTNYIQPQLSGGLRATMTKELNTLVKGNYPPGQAEVLVNVDAKGAITGTSLISENPKGGGLGRLLENALRRAQFFPAYENGKPAAGAVNVVADYNQLF